MSTQASGALETAQQLNTEVGVLDEDVQGLGLSALSVLIGRGADDLSAFAAAEKRVVSDLAALGWAPGLTPDQVNALPSLNALWQAGRAHRASVQQLGTSHIFDPAVSSALEDSVSADVASMTHRLDALESAGASHLAGLQRERDAAVQASAIAVVIALALGLIIALWISSRLARSVLRPLSALKRATTRLARGDLTHRVATGSGDEVAELGEAFDSMAGQLEAQHDAVKARERQLAALVENASDGILVLGAGGGIRFATPAFREYVDTDSSPDARLSDITHPDDLDRVTAAWEQAVSGGEGCRLEVEARLQHRDGSWRHVWAKLTNRFADEAVSGMVINISDVSERHEYEQQLSFQALHDALTGLPNRELFRQRLERSAITAGRRGVNSVLYLDFDDFKRINDTFGHQAGDTFLVTMAERLSDTVRPEDTVARLGGDEFAILLEGTDTRSAVITTERVLAALQKPLMLEGKDVMPRASAGVATAAPGSASPDTLLADADLAMYFAKRHGKAQYRVFSPAMRTDLLDRLQLGEDLRTAVDTGAIAVDYQPMVDMQTGAIVGAEALARWNHQTRGWVGPATFIPLAEELNLVARIDALVLRQACLQGRAWADAGLPPLHMAVNVSGSNLDNPDFVESVARTLEQTGFDAANLELELTEGVVIAESGGAVATLESLKALGLHLAIDDFGTGYSALSRLRALPFDTLKVDKVFVDELAAANPGSTLAESILDMARVLGLKVVAEGVETPLQAEYLRRRGCDLAQGYLFSRPVDASAFQQLLVAATPPHPLEVESAIA